VRNLQLSIFRQPLHAYIRLHLLMMGLHMPETCRSWRNILRISCASRWFFFTRLDIHLAGQTGPATQPVSSTMATESFPGVKRQGSAFDHHPHLALRLRKVKLYLYFLSGPSWHVLGWTIFVPSEIHLLPHVRLWMRRFSQNLNRPTHFCTHLSLDRNCIT
jgi:hypothetical protein